MSHLEYFGLQGDPFSNAPVGRLFFNGTPHAHALARLNHVVQNAKGLAVLVGEVGAGKSTLARRLLTTLPESEYEASLLVVIHSDVTAEWLMRRIAQQLGVEAPSSDKLEVLGQIYERLLEIHQSNRRAVVLIDEAQMLQKREIMQELRGLLNLELPEEKLLSIVLFGLPELEKNLRLDMPLQQRVAVKVHLSPLDRASTEAYIKHRLRGAGARRMPFSAQAVGAIHSLTGGTPRLINTLCDNSLLEASLAQSPVVSEKLVRQCASELGLAEEQRPAHDFGELDRYLSGTETS